MARMLAPLVVPFLLTGACAVTVTEHGDGGREGRGVRLLGGAGPLGCDRGALLRRLPAQCKVHGVASTSGSGPGSASSNASVDGNLCTLWNAGAVAPQEVTLDLGREENLTDLVMVPGMTPDGAVRHLIKTSADGVTYTTTGVIDGPMAEREAYRLTLARPVQARFIRIVTAASPSWVAWYELAALDCD
jgi:hypothetical protein